MPARAGGLNPCAPMLDVDTTHDVFRDDLLTEPLEIQGQGQVSVRVRVRPRSSGAWGSSLTLASSAAMNSRVDSGSTACAAANPQST